MKLRITIDGRAFEAEVELMEDEESPAAEMTPFSFSDVGVPASAHALGGDPKLCRSPVTGLVIKVNVAAGQHVQAGELMLAIEAMKMETNLTAQLAATVKSVHVKPGDPVKVNQTLVEFE